MAKYPEPNCSTEKATFAMGCFWGTEAQFGVVPGVIHTKVGYIGGRDDHFPTYHNLADYTEAAEFDFDPQVISYDVSCVSVDSSTSSTSSCLR